MLRHDYFFVSDLKGKSSRREGLTPHGGIDLWRVYIGYLIIGLEPLLRAGSLPSPQPQDRDEKYHKRQNTQKYSAVIIVRSPE